MSKKCTKVALSVAIALAILAIFCSPVWSLSRTSWQMHDGLEVTSDNPLGLLAFDCSPSRHGDECEYSVSTIPPKDDSGWGAAPDGDIINFSLDRSRVCEAPDTCYAYGDFTYFQTFVDIPANTEVTEFTISFSGMDDGSRVSIFNSNHEDGLVIPGSYVYLGGTGTTNLKDYVVAGEVNRVVITQVDDCCSQNNLREASVVLNGEDIVVIDPEIPCTITQDDVDAAYQAGRQACIDDPASCGIPVGPDCLPLPDTQDCAATFDMITNTLHIPNFQNIYWLDFGLVSWDTVQFELKEFGTLE